MKLRFCKMHGLGNDFVVVNGLDDPMELEWEQIRRLADRRLGVGCDQLLIVTRSNGSDADFAYRIYNADGGEVEQCGNGARCVALFLRDRGLVDGGTISIDTAAGILEMGWEDDGRIRVNMGEPVFEPARIPFQTDRRAVDYELEVNQRIQKIGVVSIGNPHAVLRVDDIASAPVDTLGSAIEWHPRFPNRVNVGFMQVDSPSSIRLRVYERGTGETLACGSGACAAVAVGHEQGLLDSRVAVRLPGGELVISWLGKGNPIWMTGPAVRVYEGEIEL
ncbi:MAG: diaminopimelate epimerase [Gammaproteobacteria bacterium]|nr:MAG: diaminopimelate epimerase [Gammaproteobacteria bacterium]